MKKENIVSFLSGLVFALGLGTAGMTRPAKVTAFLDFTGFWDPSLALVMVGAIAVYMLALRFNRHPLPPKRKIDRKLVMGSALFGIGWGLAGFCPGPAVTSLVTLASPALIFVAAMLAGMALFRLVPH